LSVSDLRVLAEEQAALSRVATLVAQGAAPEEVFAAVAEEVGQLFAVDLATVCRYDSGRTLTFVASWGGLGERFAVGSQAVLGGNNVGTAVFETGRPVRIDHYAERASGVQGARVRDAGVRSAVGTPILVEGRLWGVITVASSVEQSLPLDTDARLVSFTELVATGIANAQSRAALARLAEEQAALRRVATLVARGVPPEEVFAAVTAEAGQLLAAQLAGMGRYESSQTVTVLAAWAAEGEDHPLVPGPWPLEGGDLASAVFQTGRPVWIEDYRGVPGRIAAFVRDELGIGSSVASPILVEGRLWGVLFLHSKVARKPFAPDAESRLTVFTELVATAIANAENLAALAASRARIVAAADEARRRIEGELHDGIQRQLVSLMLDMRMMQASVPAEFGQLDGILAPIAERLAGVSDQVRAISHGVHPAILSRSGLEPALRSLAGQSVMPVELHLRAARRLPEHVEVAAYYAVSEALTNAAKHAHASAVHVELDTPGAILQLAIRDDGIGGADPAHGSGLVGLSDRIEALGGTLQITSPAGSGTTLLIKIPAEDPISPRSPGPAVAD
jgi:signal transduction histidine kinase